MKYLIEYDVDFKKGKEIGKDEIFSGEGLFYIIATAKTHATLKAQKKIRKMFPKPLKVRITRNEEAYS